MTGGRPTPGMLLLAAASVAVVALALPWQNTSVRVGVGPTYLPGYCGIGADGYGYCDPGLITTGVTTSAGGPVSGFAGPIRVIAVLAALLLWSAWRGGSRQLAVAGIILAGAGLFADGSAVTSGRLAWLLALTLVVVAWRRRGINLLNPQRWSRVRRAMLRPREG
jgi:hypothetical protein